MSLRKGIPEFLGSNNLKITSLSQNSEQCRSELDGSPVAIQPTQCIRRSDRGEREKKKKVHRKEMN